MLQLFIAWMAPGLLTLVLWLPFCWLLEMVGWDILFFRGLSALALAVLTACLFSVGLLRAIKVPKLLSCVPQITGSAMTIAGGISIFFVVFPVTFDRSVTIFLLTQVGSSAEQGISQLELEQRLCRVYVTEQHAVDRRIREQIRTGTIRTDDSGMVTLTQKGKNLLCMGERIQPLLGYTNPFLDHSCSRL